MAFTAEKASQRELAILKLNRRDIYRNSSSEKNKMRRPLKTTEYLQKIILEGYET